jgi:hypothetical protein
MNISIFAIILVLTLTLPAFFLLPFQVNAQQSVANVASNTYLVLSPNPIGINQLVNVMFWLDNTPPQIYSNYYYGWNFTLSITKPDGTIETKGPYESDPVGGCFIIYTPTVTGKYQFQAQFLGATLNLTSGSMPRGVYNWQPSLSRVVELIVQQTPIQAWPEVPLPTSYWSYPINAENRDWYKIAGNWIGAGSPAYFTQAPNSSHILWTKQLTFGGISGEQGWGINWYTGLLYENKFKPIIISGRLYYNIWTGPGMFAANVPNGVICVDMQTGEEIWVNKTMPQITAAQILRFDSGFQSGTTAYLWTVSGTSWQMYDAFSGDLLTTFVNASGGLSPVYGPNGEFLVYSLSGTTNRLTMWNSTKAVIPVDPRETAATYKPWTVKERNWLDGIQLNVTVPDVAGSQSIQFTDYASGVIVAQSTITGFGLAPIFVHVGYDTKTGMELWVKNWTNVGWGAGGPTSAGLLTFTKAQGEGVYSFFQKETMQWHVVDLRTGQERWVTESLNKFTNDDYSVYDWSGQIAYGKLIVDGYSGCVVAFDLQTGKHLWTFDQGSSGLMTPYGTWPSFGGVTIADNKVYFGVTEHTPNTPMLRGYRLYCLDIETGELLWEMPGFFTSMAISGGKLVGYAGYDNQIYCYDKGLSETRVTATVGGGRAITIQGNIVDQSPGQTAIGVPAAGTPAIADEYMDQWMAYLYMQQPMPTNATGVSVKISITDENGNLAYNTQVASDVLGHYAISWVPANNGLYTVTAAFEGTNSYYASMAVTSIAIDNEPNSVPTATPQVTSNPTTVPTATPVVIPTASPSAIIEPSTNISAETLLIAGAAAIIIAVVIVAALVLRKRK